MSKKSKLAIVPKIETPSLIKLDLSYGSPQNRAPYIRAVDPLVYPWALDDASVEEAMSLFLFQRVPARDRGKFMDELHRVLVPGGKALIMVPYWSSPRAVQDPLAEWPPLCEQSFLYFNKKFREDNGLDYGMTCDFDFVYGYNLDPETSTRTDDVRPFWIKHYTNAVSDLHVTLTKK